MEPIGAARFVVAVGAFRAIHDAGPSWRQAARAAGWRWGGNAELEGRMFTLRSAGLIAFSPEPRSLDVTLAGRGWALATLSPARAKELR
jgi:hypothetical protein